jgi:hypothetical protein
MRLLEVISCHFALELPSEKTKSCRDSVLIDDLLQAFDALFVAQRSVREGGLSAGTAGRCSDGA